jgi:hypothetical protein
LSERLVPATLVREADEQWDLRLAVMGRGLGAVDLKYSARWDLFWRSHHGSRAEKNDTIAERG